SAVNTTAETRAVRVRNSGSRSLRATIHACASSSPIGPRAPNRPPVRLRDVGGPPPCARRKVDEAAAPLERDIGRELDPLVHVVRRARDRCRVPTARPLRDRKSTRLNSSHVAISYAVFCLKKKTVNKYLGDC